MQPLGLRQMSHNFPSIDNMSWGKRLLNGPNAEFYARDYDLIPKAGNKKRHRQQAQKEIEAQMKDKGI